MSFVYMNAAETIEGIDVVSPPSKMNIAEFYFAELLRYIADLLIMLSYILYI